MAGGSLKTAPGGGGVGGIGGGEGDQVERVGVPR